MSYYTGFHLFLHMYEISHDKMLLRHNRKIILYYLYSSASYLEGFLIIPVLHILPGAIFCIFFTTNSYSFSLILFFSSHTFYYIQGEWCHLKLELFPIVLPLTCSLTQQLPLTSSVKLMSRTEFWIPVPYTYDANSNLAEVRLTLYIHIVWLLSLYYENFIFLEMYTFQHIRNGIYSFYYVC